MQSDHYICSFAGHGCVFWSSCQGSWQQWSGCADLMASQCVCAGRGLCERLHRGLRGSVPATGERGFCMQLYITKHFQYSQYTTVQKFGVCEMFLKVFSARGCNYLNKNTVQTVILSNIITISSKLLSISVSFKMYVYVMHSCIFSIIPPVFSVTWSSEIILMCWFAAQ